MMERVHLQAEENEKLHTAVVAENAALRAQLDEARDTIRQCRTMAVWLRDNSGNARYWQAVQDLGDVAAAWLAGEGERP